MERLFPRACSDRMRGNGFKLKYSRFVLDNRIKFFTLNIERHQNQLQNIADAPSWEAFKASLEL